MDIPQPTSSLDNRFTSVEIKRVDPLQAGKVLGVLYGLLSLIFAPFLLIGPMLGGAEGAVATIPVLFMMVLYPIIGFIGGAICAFLYNLTAGWVGGFEIQLH